MAQKMQRSLTFEPAEAKGRKTMLLPTSLVGSYCQPEWLIDREKLKRQFPPRTRARELWRVDAELLGLAQDDATRLAILDQERAGLDIVTDGEIRRESYSNHFATALDGVDLDQLRARSIGLTEAFIAAVDALDLPELRLLTPRDPERRGSQVSLVHAMAYEVAQALIERKVIVDFRAPDIVRFGFSPFYTRFADVGQAVAVLDEILRTEAYREPAYAQRNPVT